MSAPSTQRKCRLSITIPPPCRRCRNSCSSAALRESAYGTSEKYERVQLMSGSGPMRAAVLAKRPQHQRRRKASTEREHHQRETTAGGEEHDIQGDEEE